MSPLAWCSAQPSGPVTREAFETVCAMLLDDLAECGPVDAVYLDLHGAMVAAHVEDADGELLERVRGRVGPGVVVIASLDFHANVSPRMVAAADALVGYRTYPHVDMAETGARAYRVLRRLLGQPRWACFWERPSARGCSTLCSSTRNTDRPGCFIARSPW